MKFQLPDGREITLKSLPDADYERAASLARGGLEICPTCYGCEKSVGTKGYKEWHSEGYRYKGKHYDCACRGQIALFARYLLANIGEQYMRLDWNDFAGTPEADEWVRKYIANWSNYLRHGFGLTFAAKAQGVGKTWAATHIGKELIKKRQKVYFQDFVQMVDAFCGEREDKRAVEDRMRETTVLIIDDVLEGISDRQQDLYALKFEVVIRHRTNFNLPTIFTTNLTEDRFEQEFPRIHSLIHARQKWVTMNGVDYRKKSETAIETLEMASAGETRPIT